MVDRRTFLAGIAAVAAMPAIADAATFPSPTRWRYRLGPLRTPFVIRGDASDLAAFSTAMREAIYDVATKDVPQVLTEASKGSLATYLGRIRPVADSIMSARPAGPPPDATDLLAIPDATRRTAYATVAAAATLTRWRAAAIAAAMEPLAARRPAQTAGPYAYKVENQGMAFGHALLSRAAARPVPQPALDVPRAMRPWQVEVVSLTTDATFADLRSTPLQEPARNLGLAFGYAETVSKGPRRHADAAEAAANRYAQALFASSLIPVWAAVAA